MSLTWPNHVLHRTRRRRSGKDTRIRCTGSIYSLLNEKDWGSIKQDRTQIILYDTLPAFCIPQVVWMESQEIIYFKVYVSPRPPTTISFKDNWMKELDSKVAGSSKDTQRIQPKSKKQWSRTVRPVGEQLFTKEIEKDVLFRREGTKNSTRTERLVDGPKSIQSCVSMLVKIEEDQTRTERPVGEQQSTKVDVLDIDFRVPGLSHAVVKEAEHVRVQELVKKIESHPHWEALQADLQQNNVYNPLSNKSKAMIRELGNVELFELCETFGKVQCSHCVLCCNHGIVYCIFGQCLIDSESRRKFDKLRLDALFIPHYVIKKGASHGARMDRPKVQRDGRTCTRRPYISSYYRGIQKIPRTNGISPWTIQVKNGPLKLRSDFRAAVSQKPSPPRVRRTMQTMASLIKHIVVGQVWMEFEMSWSEFVNSSSF